MLSINMPKFFDYQSFRIKKGVDIMGNLIKINMYADNNKKENKRIDISILNEHFIAYKKWLEKTEQEDIVENYQRFLIIE